MSRSFALVHRDRISPLEIRCKFHSCLMFCVLCFFFWEGWGHGTHMCCCACVSCTFRRVLGVFANCCLTVTTVLILSHSFPARRGRWTGIICGDCPVLIVRRLCARYIWMNRYVVETYILLYVISSLILLALALVTPANPILCQIRVSPFSLVVKMDSCGHGSLPRNRTLQFSPDLQRLDRRRKRRIDSSRTSLYTACG